MEITFNTGFQEGGNAILEKATKKTKNQKYNESDDFFIGMDTADKPSFKESTSIY